MLTFLRILENVNSEREYNEGNFLFGWEKQETDKCHSFKKWNIVGMAFHSGTFPSFFPIGHS